MITILFTSCTSDDVEEPINETDGLTMLQEFENTEHTIEVYSKLDKFYTGYNHLSIRVKNNADNTYFQDISLSWMPMMVMQTMNHSCPKSALIKMEDKASLYSGYTIFQMTGVNGTGWSLKFTYTINGTDYVMEENINVSQSLKQNVTTFTGNDATKYIMAIVEPMKPEIAINEYKIALHKMESMMLFPVVEDYIIKLDPRMPSMGNHSSPNNTDLIYHTSDKLYHGNLSLTMSGYWVLNHKLLNQDDIVLKGEDIVDGVLDQSSLFLEIEF